MHALFRDATAHVFKPSIDHFCLSVIKLFYKSLMHVIFGPFYESVSSPENNSPISFPETLNINAYDPRIITIGLLLINWVWYKEISFIFDAFKTGTPSNSDRIPFIG